MSVESNRLPVSVTVPPTAAAGSVHPLQQAHHARPGNHPHRQHRAQASATCITQPHLDSIGFTWNLLPIPRCLMGNIDRGSGNDAPWML